ncbi:MAG: CHAD domain-containing protein [Bradyrhizobiaceae bacterium]|nr:CHAD domain-containing protein [Bradyrhizobiaceae bacterium]
MREKPALRPDIAIGRALTDVAQGVLKETRAPLSDRTMMDAEVVHDVRKALKRWRALLRLLEPFLPVGAGRELRIAARDLARGLAQARDPRSVLDALEDLTEANPGLSQRSLESIRKRVDRLRVSAETAILTDEARARLSTEFAAIEETIAAWSLDRLKFDDVADSLTKTYHRARRAVPDDWQIATVEELHDLRKRVVEHRYQMELIEPLWPKLGRVWVGEAQRLRDRLGCYHDLDMLSRLTRPNKRLGMSQARLLPLVRERQREHLRVAARLAGRLFAEKPNAFRSRLMRLWESRATAMAD